MKDTHDLEFIRDYPVHVDRLWRAVTQPEEIVQWFGSEGVRIESREMDFTKNGPWFCVMQGIESGGRLKVAGQVTHVRPPASGGEGSVGFTWAWYDDKDTPGPESHVTFTVAPTENGARFTLSHRDLSTLEASQNHSRGWLSTLSKLDKIFA